MERLRLDEELLRPNPPPREEVVPFLVAEVERLLVVRPNAPLRVEAVFWRAAIVRFDFICWMAFGACVRLLALLLRATL